jgi:hypothetical protein
MNNQRLSRACVRLLLDHLTRVERRPVALGCKLERSRMTADDVAIIWARVGEELRARPSSNANLAAPDWGPLRELLAEYRAVVRERRHRERRRGHGRSCVARPERCAPTE